MVSSSSADVYSPFQSAMLPEDGPQSSEEGSGLHSPVFGAPYATHGDSFRYQHDQLDVHPSASAIIPPQYDYSLNAQQPPILDSLELPSSASARHVTFPSSHYSLQHRNHLGIDFSPPSSRIPPAPHAAPPLDFRYSSSTERRLPGGSSHDHSYNRPSGSSAILPMDSDHRSSLVAPSAARIDTSPTAEPSTSSREPRKEISSVVIACRQCRSRKIRCDSTRPVCNNCVRRSNECQYDLVPKRRGPDKRPGTRQRSCKKRPADGSAPPPPKRKRTIASTTPDQQPSSQRSTEQRELLPSSSSSSSRVKDSMQDNKRPSPPSRHHHLDRQQQQQQPQQDPHGYPHLHPSSSSSSSGGPGAPPSPTDLRLPTDPESHFKHDLSSPYSRRSSSSASYMYDQGSSYPKPSFRGQLGVNPFPVSAAAAAAADPHHQHHHRSHLDPTSPSIEQANRVWWDKILSEHTPNDLATELTFLYNNTGHLLSFINLNYFIHRLNHAEERLRLQPAFIYAVLAMAKLMKSSSVELAVPGVRAAIMYSSEAHAAYAEAIRTNWKDHNLAEAALILALFESSAYPHHTPERATNALVNLDDLISHLNLTVNDNHDPDVNHYSPNMVPMVLLDTYDYPPPPQSHPHSSLHQHQHQQDQQHQHQQDHHHHHHQPPRECGCFPAGSIDPPDPYSTRPYVLPWDSNWSVAQIEAEEIRRLCWAALTLVSEYVAQCEAFSEVPPRFFLADPANFALLFPGEVLDRVSPSYRADQSLSTKESVWALYCRSMLLWNFSNRFRAPSQEEERAEQAHEAFLEAQAIEDSLNCHRCNLDTTLMYTCREYIHNTRMLVAQALRRPVFLSFHGIDNGKATPGPIFKRKQAEDWLFYEEQVIRRANTVINHLNTPEGYQLTRRPFRINWFINQLTICLLLWSLDPTLDDALKLAKSILRPIDVLNALWTCPSIQVKCDSLRRQLEQACNSRQLEGPHPPGFSLPTYRS